MARRSASAGSTSQQRKRSRPCEGGGAVVAASSLLGAAASARLRSRSGMYVLLVEDDPRIARVVERALTEAGHRVDVVYEGDEGLMRGESGAYDLIVLDV